MKVHITIAAAMLLVCGPAWAQSFESSCWVLTNLKGEAVYKQDGYKVVPDGFLHTNPKITLIFGSGRAQASGDNIPLLQSDTYIATGAASNDTFSVAETYAIDPPSGTVLFTKAMFGRGSFDGMTSTKMFRGDARPCQ